MDAFRNKIINPHNFTPDKSIPDLAGKVILVTGGNQGIGLQTVLELSKHNPAKIYLAARSQAKYDDALNKIKETAPENPGFGSIEFLELDLSSLASVKAAADKVLAGNDRLDTLVNSAGIMGAPPGTTKEGFESHFGVNHMGHALLTRQLLPLMEKTAATGADVRIVNVTSLAVSMAPGTGILFDKLTTDMNSYHSFRNYGQSKLANVLHANELARRYPTITTVSVHPGRVATGLLDGFFGASAYNPMALFQRAYDWSVGTLTVEEGALTSLWAATYPKGDVGEGVKSGEMYVPIGKEWNQDKRINDEDLAKQLWDWQEDEFKKTGFA